MWPANERENVGTRFSTCAMERRPVPNMINDPLLENLLQKWMNEGIREVVCQFFGSAGMRTGGDLPRSAIY